jgi:hypothetical protein
MIHASSVQTAVMSIVTFPAEVIGPGITAEAAKMALHDLILDKQDTKPTMEGGEHKTSEKDVSKDAMDEDTADKSTAIDACPNTTISIADDISVNGPPSKPMPPTPSTPPAPPTAISAATAVTTTPLALLILPTLSTPIMPTAKATAKATATAIATYTAPPTSLTQTPLSLLSAPTLAIAAAISSSPPSHILALFRPSALLLSSSCMTTNQSMSVPTLHLLMLTCKFLCSVHLSQIS